jgi:hypothetical protein
VRGAQLLGKAAPYVNAAVRGAGFSGAQTVGAGESRAANTALGGALGAGGEGVSALGGKLASSAKAAIPDAVQESIDLARRAGIPLHLSQVTNSKALKTVSSALNYLPFSGAGKAGRLQQEGFNRAVSKSFDATGKGSKYLTDDVMAESRKNIGKIYDDIFARHKVTLGNDTLRKMAAVENEAHENLTSEEARIVSNQFQKIVREAGESGDLAGPKYQALRGKLREASKSEGVQRYVKKLGQELDAAAHASVGEKDAAALKFANGLYANMKTTEDALRQAKGAAGNVSPASLWNLVRNGSTKEMRALAKIGKNVLQDPIPDSGTPARELVYRGLGMGGGTAGAASALGLLMPAAKLAATGVTAARFLNSRTAAKLLGEGRPTGALARLLKGSPYALPLLAPEAAAQERKP